MLRKNYKRSEKFYIEDTDKFLPPWPTAKSTVEDCIRLGLTDGCFAWDENPDFPCYLVGYNGSVISLLGKTPRLLKPNVSGRYPMLTLRNRRGKFYPVTIHTLVASTYISLRPEGMECCHNDGNVTNLSADNLRWDTPAKNNEDKIKHGTHREGEKINFAKLNRDAVIEIRRLWKSGELTRTEIARKFKITLSNARLVATGMSWTHIREGLDD